MKQKIAVHCPSSSAVGKTISVLLNRSRSAEIVLRSQVPNARYSPHSPIYHCQRLLVDEILAPLDIRLIVPLDALGLHVSGLASPSLVTISVAELAYCESRADLRRCGQCLCGQGQFFDGRGRAVPSSTPVPYFPQVCSSSSGIPGILCRRFPLTFLQIGGGIAGWYRCQIAGNTAVASPSTRAGAITGTWC